MDVIQFLVSLVDLHKQQLQALARQSEIQAKFLAQLLDQDELVTAHYPRDRNLGTPMMDLTVEDPEAYLTVVEEAASSCKLPQEEWGAKLSGLLYEEMNNETFLSSKMQTLRSYDDLKAKILRKAQAAEKQHRIDFLSVRYDPQKGARDLGERLDLAAKRWLKPDRRTSAQVEQQVAMEQFVSLLPKEAGVWVHRQHPRNMEEAICMAEQCLSCSTEEDSSFCDTAITEQIDMTDSPSEPGEAGKAEPQINSSESSTKECFNESFFNKLDTIKLESVQVSLEIPEMETVYLEDDGSVSAFKQKFSEPDFTGTAEIHHSPDQLESSRQKPVYCTQGPQIEKCIDMRRRIRTANKMDSTPLSERLVLMGGQREGTAVSPVHVPRECRGPSTSTMSSLSHAELEVAAPQSFPPLSLHLPPELELPCFQAPSIKTSVKEKDGQSAWPFLPKSTFKMSSGKKMALLHLKDSSKTCDLDSQERPLKTHTGERAHRCPDCGHSFTQVSSLLEHRNIHTGEKPFRCKECGKAFHHRRTLNKHSRVHSRERPFHCSQCGWTFKLKDALRRHQLTHNREKSKELSYNI